jgi:hypothetical protein
VVTWLASRSQSVKECPQSRHEGSSALVDERRSVAPANRSEASAAHGYLKGTRYEKDIPRRGDVDVEEDWRAIGKSSKSERKTRCGQLGNKSGRDDLCTWSWCASSAELHSAKLVSIHVVVTNFHQVTASLYSEQML